MHVETSTFNELLAITVLLTNNASYSYLFMSFNLNNGLSVFFFMDVVNGS